jgi:myosin heavy subunit
LAKDKFKKIIAERDGAMVVQANWRAFMTLKDWLWMHLIYKIRPLLNSSEKKKEMDELQSEYDELKKQLEIETKARKLLEDTYVKLVQGKNSIIAAMNGETDALGDAEDRAESLTKTKVQLDARIKELQERLEDEEEINSDLVSKKAKLEAEIRDLRKDVEALEAGLQKVELEKTAIENSVKQKCEELQCCEELLDKVNFEYLIKIIILYDYFDHHEHYNRAYIYFK